MRRYIEAVIRQLGFWADDNILIQREASLVMASTLKSLRALSDPTRLRIVALLEKNELSVNELQEITQMGQSRISTHLGLLQDAELVQSRREGKRTFYRLVQNGEATVRVFIHMAVRGARELAEHASDQVNLKRILGRRSDQ